MNKPLISVLLPAYNAEPYIEESVRSILNQTYTNFEFIIINNGSTDRTGEIIENIKDPRIRFFSNENLGMAGALNKAIKLSTGELFARQDADDISYLERFQKQVDFLNNNPDVAIVGTWARIIPQKDNIVRLHKHPTDNLVLKFELLWDNPFVHTSMMMRKSCIDKVGPYDLDEPVLTQDYDLWWRIIKQYKVANIGEVLVDYREVATGLSQTTIKYAAKVAEKSVRNVKELLQKDSPAIISLANLVHGTFEGVSKDFNATQIEELYNEIYKKLVEGETSGDKKQLRKRVDEVILQMIRKLKRYRQMGPFYNSYLSLYKTYSKLKRKL